MSCYQPTSPGHPCQESSHSRVVEQGLIVVENHLSDGDECKCEPFIEKIKSRFNEALLTKREHKRRTRMNRYRKLGKSMVESAFNACVNWLVHGKFLLNVLPVSMGWFSARHSEAIEKDGAPTQSITEA